MIERFFLDRVDIFCDRLAVNQGEEFPCAVFSHAAPSAPPIGDQAVKAAEIAADLAAFERFPEFCRMKVHGDIIAG